MLTQEQAEEMATAYVEKYISEMNCANLTEVELALQKFAAIVAFAYLAVTSKEETVGMLEFLADHHRGQNNLKPKLTVIEKGKLNG